MRCRLYVYERPGQERSDQERSDQERPGQERSDQERPDQESVKAVGLGTWGLDEGLDLGPKPEAQA
jgi:hypothetical protein